MTDRTSVRGAGVPNVPTCADHTLTSERRRPAIRTPGAHAFVKRTGVDGLLWGFLSRLRAKLWATFRARRIFAVDLVLCAVALGIATTVRFGFDAPAEGAASAAQLTKMTLLLMAVCAIVFPLTGLYQRSWKYASLVDLLHIAKAVVLASVIFVSIMFIVTRLDLVPRSVLVIHVLLLVPLMAMARLRSRFRELSSLVPVTRTTERHQDVVPVLLIGANDATELYLRALQRDPNPAYWPVGILDASPEMHGLTLREVPVLGGFDAFETVLFGLEQQGRRPRHLIFAEKLSELHDEDVRGLIERAQRLGLAISRLTPPTQLTSSLEPSKFEIRPIELTDLLERPQAVLDRDVVRRLISGRRVLVTGAGGSIGSELSKQIAALSPSELILIDNCEYNIYAIDLELGESYGHVARTPYLCSVRDANRIDEIFSRHRPEIVFHAAALKHVPMVELNPCEGMLTNAIGSRIVADAVRRFGALAMVQISTDKVVNPTSVMGATKRIAELYCQALDIDGAHNPNAPRFMTVRFGNVLGSSGSLIPLFKRQIARGGPLTVTHPEITRFFMTIREAVELTLQASAQGLEKSLGHGGIFVLDMGEPIPIVDIARRMIKLAGFVPDQDIKIEFVGLRPGEKLFEELFDDEEHKISLPIEGVLGAVSRPIRSEVVAKALTRLKACAEAGDMEGMFETAYDLLPNYRYSRAQPAIPGPDVEENAATLMPATGT